MCVNVSTQTLKQNSKTPMKSNSLGFFFILNLDEQLDECYFLSTTQVLNEN